MDNHYIQFGSMTHAMKAKELLTKHHIRARLVRTPEALRRRSCGYSLQLTQDYDRAMSLLRQHRIPIAGTSAADAP